MAKAHAQGGFAGISVIGAAGFEPATPCSQSRCATKLRHAPLKLRVEPSGGGW